MPARPAWRPRGLVFRDLAFGSLAFLVCTLSVLAWPWIAVQAAPSDKTANGAEIVELVHECMRARTGAETCPMERQAFSLRSFLDLPAISERVGGPNWAQGSAAERERFGDLIAEIVEQEVGEKFGDRSISIRDERALPSGDVLVVGEYVAKNDRVTRLSWLLRRKSDRLLLEDISIDGISLVVASRDQIQSLAGDTDGSLDSLAALVRKRYVWKAGR